MTRITRKLFMIRIAAELLQIHPQTLRQFEREGLITPTRSSGNTRLYSEDDLERMRMILRLRRELGVNLAGIEIILDMREKMEKIQREMEQTVSGLKKSFEEELARREQLFRQPVMKSPRKDIIRIKVKEKKE